MNTTCDKTHDVRTITCTGCPSPSPHVDHRYTQCLTCGKVRA